MAISAKTWITDTRSGGKRRRQDAVALGFELPDKSPVHCPPPPDGRQSTKRTRSHTHALKEGFSTTPTLHTSCSCFLSNFSFSLNTYYTFSHSSDTPCSFSLSSDTPRTFSFHDSIRTFLSHGTINVPRLSPASHTHIATVTAASDVTSGVTGCPLLPATRYISGCARPWGAAPVRFVRSMVFGMRPALPIVEQKRIRVLSTLKLALTKAGCSMAGRNPAQ